MTIAALYVEADGIYQGLPGVEVWDKTRDARLYTGPWPVVAHPPCARWCQLASVNEARYGHRIGEDYGTFEAALKAVRTYGGILEHPAYTLAWDHYDLPVPLRGCWTGSLWDDGWVTEVSQSAYGCPARKRTWLYLHGDPLPLDWRDAPGELVVGAGVYVGEAAGRGRLQKKHASSTPPAFRDMLLSLARSAVTIEA